MRFPEFTDEWKPVRLKEIAEFQKSRISVDCLDETTYVSTENLLPNFGGIKAASSMPSDGNVMEFHPQDILISNIRPYLKKVWLSNRIGGCSADVFVLRQLCCSEAFLYYVIASDRFINYVMSGAKGVKMPRGDKGQMEDFSFSCPTIEEQKKIARLLSLIDERIATQNKIISNLQSLIKGIGHSCIVSKDNKGKWVTLKDICHITTGKLDANAMVEGGKYPFYTCAEIPFAINEYAFDTEALLISGNGANLGYINYYKGRFNAYQRTYVLDSFTENIQFVKCVLNVILPERIAIEKSTSNTPYIVMSTLADMKIFLPSEIRQNRIANLMYNLETKLQQQTTNLNNYRHMKSYLLQQMFI